MVSKRQLRAIRKNYAKRAQGEDRAEFLTTIFSTIFNIPSGVTVGIIILSILYAMTDFIFFLIGVAILVIIDILLIYNAFARYSRRLSKGFF